MKRNISGNKAIDKVGCSNNTFAVNSLCGINITVLFQVRYKYTVGET